MTDVRMQARSTVTGPTRRALAFGTLAIGALALGGCNRGKAGDARAETTAVAATTVGRENVAVATTGTVVSGPQLSGTLSFEREATIRAQIGGAVLQTLADAGQQVSSGELLARLDDAGVRDAYLSARSGVTSAENSADLAAKELARSEKLVAAGAIAERDVDQARRANVGAQAALADARARLASAEKQLENTKVAAPFSGVVGTKSVSAGDVVAPGAPLFTVVAPSSMRLEASVPAEQLSAVRVGMPVKFTVSGYGDRPFVGRITRVSPVADPTTRQVSIIASIPNAGNTLVGGLFAEGRVSSESRTGVVVPLSAVDERGLSPFVMRIRDGRAEKAPVTIGIRDAKAETLEITQGLAAGDTVLLGAAMAVSDKTPIKVGTITDKPVAEKP